MNFVSRMHKIWKQSQKEERRYRPERELDANGREHIVIKLDSPDAAYSRFSPEGKRRIDPEAWQYLTEENRNIAPLVIEVKNHDMAGDPGLAAEFKKTLFEESRFQNFVQYRKRRMNAVKAWMLLLAGIVIITVSILLRAFASEGVGLFFETIDILTWVLIWEAFDAFIFVRAGLKRKYMFTYRIRAAEIVFIE